MTDTYTRAPSSLIIPTYHTAIVITNVMNHHHHQVVDLSADFRLYDVEVYKKWYGEEHKAPELQKEAVYAITEVDPQNKSHTRRRRQGMHASQQSRLHAHPHLYSPTHAVHP